MTSISVILWDVDNTLYPRDCGIGPAMGKRIVEYVSNHVDVENIPHDLPAAEEVLEHHHAPDIVDEAEEPEKSALVKRLCKYYYKKYGLSIVGLAKHFDIDEHEYLEFVHHPSTVLEEFLDKAEHEATKKLFDAIMEQTKLRNWVFSNAHDDHVNRILTFLDIHQKHHWHGMVEYKQLRENCKPGVEAYRYVMKRLKEQDDSIEPANCLFWDDSADNLKTAKEEGMRTVLVNGGKRDPSPWIDFQVTDIRATQEVEQVFQKLGIHIKLQ